MKTKEELTAVKEKAEAMNEKDCKLTDEELLRFSGGFVRDIEWKTENSFLVVEGECASLK